MNELPSRDEFAKHLESNVCLRKDGVAVDATLDRVSERSRPVNGGSARKQTRPVYLAVMASLIVDPTAETRRRSHV